MSDEAFQELRNRVITGKAWIQTRRNNWNSTHPFVQDAIKRWHMLSDECLQEALRRGELLFPDTTHSKAWNILNDIKSLQKTPKVKNGQAQGTQLIDFI